MISMFINYTMLWGRIPLVLVICIPLVILIGQWVRGGAITAASSGALVADALFWWYVNALLQADAQARVPYSATGNIATGEVNATGLAFTLIIGGALLLTASSVALVDAVRAHRWIWLGALVLGAYVTVAFFPAANLFTPESLNTACVFAPSNPAVGPLCTSTNTFLAALSIASLFVGPAVTLVYALRHSTRRERTLPDGLSATPLDAPTMQPE